MKLHKCPECKGKREVFLFDKYEWCPLCDGLGHLSAYQLFLYRAIETEKLILIMEIACLIVRIMM